MPKSKACERVPGEIWKTILEWVIDGLLLFSTDPYEYDWQPRTRRSDWTCVMHIVDPETKEIWWGRTDRPAMRQFRATRAKLRLVCKAWQVFADSPSLEYRCTRLCMSSTSTELLQPSTVLKAKRLEVLSGFVVPDKGAAGLVVSTIEQVKKFNAEIVLDIGGMFTSAVLCNFQRLFPHLRVLSLDLSGDVIPELHIEKIDSLLWKLESLTSLIMRVGPGFSLPNGTVLQLPYLRTLSISSGKLLGELHMDSWVLPSLEHLELDVLPEHTACKRFLQRQGRSLRYLSVRFAEIHSSVSDFGVLHSCPNLLYLAFPLALAWLERAPQDPHPLLRLVNTTLGASYAHWYTGPSIFLANAMRFCASTLRLHTITDGHSWVTVLPKVDQDPNEEGDLLPDSPEFTVRKFSIMTAQATYLLASKLDSLGIRYEDRDSLTVEQGKVKLDDILRDPKRACNYFPQ